MVSEKRVLASFFNIFRTYACERLCEVLRSNPEFVMLKNKHGLLRAKRSQ
ncbi:MAG: hypothetical protein Greene041614_683 [Parcubacteria group bacterium Greene0416_14]|nr:MAG: hypothetical protein Greene041614_683 [Parcubacteria group bacterium Greene0416_14]TSD01369.1 MAG: hypothetical protein Greene101415_304 [Parcubacteria group bacterium Greene1014_15]